MLPASPSRLISSITVGTRFRKEVGDVSSLAQSIQAVGLLHPVVVTPEGRLVAGLRRLEACKLLNLKNIPVHTVDPPSLLLAERDENGIRLSLLPSEQVAVAMACEEEESKKAKERHRQGSRRGGKGGGNLPPPSPRETTRDRIAAGLGVSGRTLEKEMAVVQAAEKDPDKFTKLVDHMDRTGKVHGAYKRLRRAQAAEKFGLPTILSGNAVGRYSIVLADPPWKYEHSETEARAVENQYPTMALDEICQLPVQEVAEDDCILFLWVPAPKLDEGLRVMREWGFSYRTCAVWIKDRIGMGYFFRQRHELLLLGVKGKPPVPLEAAVGDSVFLAPRGKHSEKPEAIQDRIEAMYPGATRLEMFARSKRDGWKSWGNES